jgi:hypothetical protein
MIANLLIGQTPEGKLIIESNSVSSAQFYTIATEALMTGLLNKKAIKEVAIIRIAGSTVDMPKHMHIPDGGINATAKLKK